MCELLHYEKEFVLIHMNDNCPNTSRNELVIRILWALHIKMKWQSTKGYQKGSIVNTM